MKKEIDANTLRRWRDDCVKIKLNGLKKLVCGKSC